MLVGNVTEVTLPNTLIDDLVFGVAAVDAVGPREPRVALHRPRSTASRRGDVKTVPQPDAR